METKRTILMIVVFLFAAIFFSGCSGSLKKVNTATDDIDQFNANIGIEGSDISTDNSDDPEALPFTASTMYIFKMHRVAFNAYGRLGVNSYVVVQKPGSENTGSVEDTSDFLVTPILKFGSSGKQVLMDFGNKLDGSRRIAGHTRIVPGYQFPIEGGLDKIRGPFIGSFDWGLYRTLDEYVAMGIIEKIEINNIGDAGHLRAKNIVAEIVKSYAAIQDPGLAERFLSGFGSFSAGDIHLMVIGSFQDSYVYPAAAVKLFNIMRAVSGTPNPQDPWYYTRNANALDVAFMIESMIASIMEDLMDAVYQESSYENGVLATLAKDAAEAWKKREMKIAQMWEEENYRLQGIDPTSRDIDSVDQETIAAIQKLSLERETMILAAYNDQLEAIAKVYPLK